MLVADSAAQLACLEASRMRTLPTLALLTGELPPPPRLRCPVLPARFACSGTRS